MAYHTFKASGQQFEVESKYSLIRPIGHGAYGVVISALNKDDNAKVLFLFLFLVLFLLSLYL